MDVKITYHPILKEKLVVEKLNSQEKLNFGNLGDLNGKQEEIVNSLKNDDSSVKFLQESYPKFFESLYAWICGSQKNSVYIEAETTRDVCEDLKNMMDLYNKNKNFESFVLRNFSELPSNKEMLDFIKDKSSEVLKILNENVENKYFDDDDDTKNSIKSSSQKITDVLEKQKEDNMINIIVLGIFSAGKSAFINALLGSDILETGTGTTTQASFEIIKSDKKEVSFVIKNQEKFENVDFVYNPQTGLFETETKNKITEDLTKKIVNLKNDADEQLKEIVKFLNREAEKNEIESKISIHYPFELGGDIPVKICDTPGTNSTKNDDKEVIEEILKNSRNTVLVTVLNPEKTDDVAGNKVLFNVLLEAEKENSNMDKSRLIFVYSHIDNLDDVDVESIDNLAQRKLKIKKDSSSESQEYSLEKYPLYFMSNSFAIASQMLLKNQNNERQKNRFDRAKLALGSINLSAQCEIGWQTEEIHQKAKSQFETLENEYEKAIVTSGLFAVREGITSYINKYASAIFATSLYNAVNKSYKELNTKLEAYKETLNKSFEEKSKNFNEEQKTLGNAVKLACENQKEKLKSGENNKRAPERFESIRTRAFNKIYELVNNSKIGTFHLQSTNEEEIRYIENVLDRFINNELLGNLPDELDNETWNINQNIVDEISSKFKESVGKAAFDDICNNVRNSLPQVQRIGINIKVEGTFLWLKKVNKEDTKSALKNSISNALAPILDFLTHFYESLAEQIDKIAKEYQNNLTSYSQRLSSMQKDKDDAQKKLKIFAEFVDSIKKQYDAIEQKIWKPIKTEA